MILGRYMSLVAPCNSVAFIRVHDLTCNFMWHCVTKCDLRKSYCLSVFCCSPWGSTGSRFIQKMSTSGRSSWTCRSGEPCLSKKSFMSRKSWYKIFHQPALCFLSFSFVGNTEIDVDIKRYYCKAGIKSIQVRAVLFVWFVSHPRRGEHFVLAPVLASLARQKRNTKCWM